ncbi:MAG: sulfotransferase [Hyphomicrobiales bacterium]
MIHENLVNFFIVGAPKCGSTSLFHALSRHPEITFGRAKEPHAFIGGLNLRGSTSIEAYCALYDFDPLFKVFGDASIMHLYSPDAAQNIAKYNPNAKILIMLREPEDFVVSYHHEQVYNGIESNLTLRVCWDLCEERREGRNVPAHCPDKRLLDYAEVARFDVQVERFLQVFDEDQIRVGFLSDIRLRPDVFMERLLDFLNVAPAPDITLEQLASAKTHKRRSVRNVVMVLSHPSVLSMWKKLRVALGISGRLKLLHRMKVANTVSGEKAKIPSQLRKKIRRHYADSWTRLNALVNDVRLLP